MKSLFLILLMISHLFALESRQVLMNSISQYALRIGSGPTKVYTFIDPLCYRSQIFIENILTREDLQKENSYYIFLYEIPSHFSKEYITYIYQAKMPLKALEDIMINENYDIDTPTLKNETQLKIDAIKRVGKETHIHKRPYVMSFKEGSPFCQVSDGTAPCLEENDFD